jgi:hypothetical protein
MTVGARSGEGGCASNGRNLESQVATGGMLEMQTRPIPIALLPDARGVGFGGRRRGRQEDEKIWCCSEQRVVEQLGGRAGDRGFAIITLRYLIWEWIGG